MGRHDVDHVVAQVIVAGLFLRALRHECRTAGVPAGPRWADMRAQLAMARDLVLRSLAFDRQRHGVGAGPAFIIAKWSDGHSTIDDPATGRHVDLAAFGEANMQTFERLVAMREAKS